MRVRTYILAPCMYSLSLIRAFGSRRVAFTAKVEKPAVCLLFNATRRTVRNNPIFRARWYTGDVTISIKRDRTNTEKTKAWEILISSSRFSKAFRASAPFPLQTRKIHTRPAGDGDEQGEKNVLSRTNFAPTRIESRPLRLFWSSIKQASPLGDASKTTLLNFQISKSYLCYIDFY